MTRNPDPGCIALLGRAYNDANGNPRKYARLVSTDTGETLDVIAYDYGNVDSILSRSGIPTATEYGTPTATEYRELERWRDNNPDHRRTECRPSTENRSGFRAYSVRLPNGRVMKPSDPYSGEPIRSRFSILSHQ